MNVCKLFVLDRNTLHNWKKNNDRNNNYKYTMKAIVLPLGLK